LSAAAHGRLDSFRLDFKTDKQPPILSKIHLSTWRLSPLSPSRDLRGPRPPPPFVRRVLCFPPLLETPLCPGLFYPHRSAQHESLFRPPLNLGALPPIFHFVPCLDDPVLPGTCAGCPLAPHAPSFSPEPPRSQYLLSCFLRR